MATSDLASATLSATPAPSLSARLLPSLTDVFFFALVFTLFLAAPEGWDRLVWDGDTGLHTRTGDYILDHGAVPTTDPFSFTKPGGRWFAFQWLTGVTFALLNRWVGLKGVVLLAGILIAGTLLVLLRNMVTRGANGLLSMLLVLVAGNAMSIHFHARPHIFTLFFLAVAHFLIARDLQRRSPAVWSLVPLTLLWANMHSGFPVILATLGLLVAGSTINAISQKSGWSAVRRYGTILALCGAATLANPNGLALYAHISQFLNNPWVLQYIDEYKSPVFRSEAMYLYLAILFGGLLSVRTMIDRAQWAQALWILFFGAASLVSARHVPIFVVVALPFIAVEATALFDQLARSQGAKSIIGVIREMSDRVSERLQPVSIWSALAVAAVAVFCTTFPTDLSAKYFPRDIVNRHASELAAAHVFTTDQWGDYLLWKNYPRQKVFMDGRSDYFQESIGNEYLKVEGAGSGWQETLDKYKVSLALVPPAAPLATALRADPAWKVVDQDSQAVLFRR
ncbi:MAG: hypothetical protein ABI972_07195 [Acidobacteriota bacterium]